MNKTRRMMINTGVMVRFRCVADHLSEKKAKQQRALYRRKGSRVRLRPEPGGIAVYVY